jgi:hypothetical protein
LTTTIGANAIEPATEDAERAAVGREPKVRVCLAASMARLRA